MADWLSRVGETKTLFCEKCEKYGKHVAISYAEAENRKHSAFGRFWGRLTDIDPFAKLVAGTPYKCLKCGRVHSQGGLAGNAVYYKEK